MNCESEPTTDRLLDRIAFLRQALYKLAIREHYHVEHICEACREPPHSCMEWGPLGKCDCGADEHNAKVLAVLEADK